MSLTDDPNDPRLTHGGDTGPTEQAKAYLILSEDERAKGFVRPVRRSYQHIGLRPEYPLCDTTAEERERYGDDFVKFEAYPEGSRSRGRFWTQKELDTNGCKTITTMASEIAETYARQPGFYGYTYCCGCQKHLPVAEFIWVDDGSVVGS